MIRSIIKSKYFKPTPKNLKKALLAMKGLLTIAASEEFFAGRPKYAFFIAMAIGVIHETVEYFFGEEEKNESK